MGDILFDKAPHLIGKILSFHEVSHKAIDLWLTGSLVVQRALAASVTAVTLHCEHCPRRISLPKILLELDSLCELVVDLGELSFTDKLSVQWTLFTIAPRLTKLVFRVDGALKLLQANPFDSIPQHKRKPYKSSAKAGHNAPRNGLQRYKLLRTLELGETSFLSRRWLSDLPPHLTRLSASALDPEGDLELHNAFDGLPASVTDLWLLDPFVPCLNSLPATVKYLSLSPTLSNDGATLSGPGCIYETVLRIPSIQKLSSLQWLKHEDRYTHPSGYSHTNFWCMNAAYLPTNSSIQGLQSLHIEQNIILDSLALSKLPRTLTELIGHVDASGITSRTWPELLVDLRATFVDNIMPTDFPPRMRALRVYTPVTSEIFSTHPALGNLESFGAAEFTILPHHPLPPSLTSLSVGMLAHSGKNDDSPFAALPAHLKALSVSDHVSLKDLLFLPSTLTSLDIRPVSKKVDSSYLKLLPARARELVEEALRNNVKISSASLEHYTSQSMSNATWIDLLPKTLTRLELEGTCDEDNWSHMPLLRSFAYKGTITKLSIRTLPLDDLISLKRDDKLYLPREAPPAPRMEKTPHGPQPTRKPLPVMPKVKRIDYDAYMDPKEQERRRKRRDAENLN